MDAVFDAEVAICTAKAGIQVLDKSTLEHAEKLLLAADVNAVPPAGFEGVGVMDNGVEIQTERGSFPSNRKRFGIGAREVPSSKSAIQEDAEFGRCGYHRFSGCLCRSRQNCRIGVLA